MSAAVMLRFAGRALGRPAASSCLRALIEKQRPLSPPIENITTRRLYSSDCVGCGKAELNKHSLFGPYTKLHNSRQEQHLMPTKKLMPIKEIIAMEVDKINSMYDKQVAMIKQLEEVIIENNKRDRRRRVLVCGAIFAGLAIYMKRHFFGGNEEDKGMEGRN